MVTDVVVQGRRTPNTPARTPSPARCMAAVGWRAGNEGERRRRRSSRPATASTRPTRRARLVHEPRHGRQRSTPQAGDPLTQARIGRIALGIADGPKQNHQHRLRARPGRREVQRRRRRARRQRGARRAPPQSDYLNGVWVSTDFGDDAGRSSRARRRSTTTRRATRRSRRRSARRPRSSATARASRLGTTSGSRRTRREPTCAGVPTRLAFGLEEVWANDPTATPPAASTARARRSSRSSAATSPATPARCSSSTNGRRSARSPTAATPTDHDAPRPARRLWVPDGSGGGVTLFAGNDGGVYKQHARRRATTLANDELGQRQQQRPATRCSPTTRRWRRTAPSTWACRTTARRRSSPTARCTRSSAATASSPRSTRTTPTSPTRSTSAATSRSRPTAARPGPTSSRRTSTSAAVRDAVQMDPNDANHLIIGGRDVEETTDGPTRLRHLDQGLRPRHAEEAGRRERRADRRPTTPTTSCRRSTCGRSRSPGNAPTGPKTKDFSYDAGGDTMPGGRARHGR